VWLCERCGSELIPQDKTCWKCGHGLSGEALTRVEAEIGAANVREAPSYADFMERAGAVVIDTVILDLPLLIVYFILKGLFPTLFDFSDQRTWWILLCIVGLVSWVYYAGMESSAKQATIGKRFIGLRVTDLKGRRVSFKRASIRYFVSWATDRMPWGLGFLDIITVAFTERKQAVHDFVAETLVMSDNHALKDEIDAPAHDRVRFGGDSLNESQPSR
jgi:uncharacterized RDD family membrane protein YckC